MDLRCITMRGLNTWVHELTTHGGISKRFKELACARPVKTNLYDRITRLIMWSSRACNVHLGCTPAGQKELAFGESGSYAALHNCKSRRCKLPDFSFGSNTLQ